MKKYLLRLMMGVLGAAVLIACDPKENEEVKPEAVTEYKFIRILVNDELTSQISLVDPVKLTAETFEGKYPKAALYNTQAGRYGAIVATSNNFLQLFDTGFEAHGDHVDVKGTPKFGALTGESNKPTHFKSKGDEIITFNDGDGTLSVAKEADFHVSGAKMKAISTGNVAHHGAMTKFDNGSYAITYKDQALAGSLPERVKIIDANGKMLFASTVETKGIHGNASDGKVSLFGSSSGILVVEPTGVQRLIPHPQKFGTAWFSSILEAKGAGKFIGYSAAVGAYVVDVATAIISPVIESADVMQAKVDFAGNNLVVLLHSGELRIYDLKTNTLVRSGAVLPATAKDETQKPQIEATSGFVYITQPRSGELLQINAKDFGKTSRVKVSATPYRLTILGAESSESH